MNKEKSSKSGYPQPFACNYQPWYPNTVVSQGMVLDVKKSIRDTTVLFKPIERFLIITHDINKCFRDCGYDDICLDTCLTKYASTNVSSISYKNTDAFEALDDRSGKGDPWYALIENDGKTKVCNVQYIKSTTYHGKKILEMKLSTKSFKAKGTTARNAVNLLDIKKGDNVKFTMIGIGIPSIPEVPQKK